VVKKRLPEFRFALNHTWTKSQSLNGTQKTTIVQDATKKGEESVRWREGGKKTEEEKKRRSKRERTRHQLSNNRGAAKSSRRIAP